MATNSPEVVIYEGDTCFWAGCSDVVGGYATVVVEARRDDICAEVPYCDPHLDLMEATVSLRPKKIRRL